MIKAVMVDVDGVLVQGRPHDGLYWSSSLEIDLGLSLDDLRRAFFAPYWTDIVLGRASLIDRLSPVLKEIAPHLTADQLIDYWFRQDSRLNLQLLQDLEKLRSGGMQIHLATNQEHMRAQYLMETLGLAKHVDSIQYSARLGARKPDPDFFVGAAEQVGLSADSLLLIDDTPDNVRGAVAAGWQAILWTNESRLTEALHGHLPLSAIG